MLVACLSSKHNLSRSSHVELGAGLNWSTIFQLFQIKMLGSSRMFTVIGCNLNLPLPIREKDKVKIMANGLHLYSAFIQSTEHLYSAFFQSAVHLYSAFIQSAVQFMPLIHPFTHTFTHQQQVAAMQGTDQLVRSIWGLYFLLRDTSTRPGWD